MTIQIGYAYITLAVQFAVQLALLYVMVSSARADQWASFSRLVCIRKLIENDDELPSGKKESWVD